MGNRLYKKYIEKFDINLLDCKFLGKGHNGMVYLLPEGKVIKICFETYSCEREYKILERINNNKYFPRVYGMCGNYMIRDYVEGIPLNKYIKRNGLSRKLSKNLINLLIEFKKLNFSKQDIRCKDIIVKSDESVMVIDPKKCYTKNRDFPRHLVKGLYNLGVLNIFISELYEYKPDLYKSWIDKITDYIKNTYSLKESD
ncbi:Predicted Ser/Thr protein kinase [Caloramator quimbayensis]|uniref:Predicted Ser/Thr protein kinase n=1 Tax=Caloramator quimbayensis TaxID=1147123 RepID=A0A1T4XU75_9CLOT|nr:protein kinase [Caloramator quimbayensis]SKA92635.1 Predicted Ser/Thr protein kinase [Caloramator quimbayensis]